MKELFIADIHISAKKLYKFSSLCFFCLQHDGIVGFRMGFIPFTAGSNGNPGILKVRTGFDCGNHAPPGNVRCSDYSDANSHFYFPKACRYAS